MAVVQLVMLNSSLKRLNKRINLLAITLLVLLTIIIIRLIQLQIVYHNDLLKEREHQYLKHKYIKANRGAIFDRDGYELAISVKTCSIYANPYLISDKVKTSEKVSFLTGIPKNIILTKLLEENDFSWIKRKINPEIKNKLSDNFKKGEGIGYVEEELRYYPENETACHILGFVNIENQGVEGLEYMYDSILKGKDGVIKQYVDARGLSAKTVSQCNPIDGKELHLTISKDIQKMVELDQKRFCYKYKLNESSVIILDANYGEILAIANYPSFNLNFIDADQRDHYGHNSAIKDNIEADPLLYLMAKTIYLENRYLLSKENYQEQSDLNIRNFNKKSICYISNLFGNETLINYLQLFGLGKKTGIPLPGESVGNVNLSDYINKNQKIMMTPLQAVKAVAIIINGGINVRPLLVKNNQKDISASNEINSKNKRIILKKTANILNNILINSVSDGDGKKEKIGNYQIGGIRHEFVDYLNKNNKKAFFVGFISCTDVNKKLVIFTMLKTANINSKNRLLKITQDFYRSISYETLRYLEVQNIENKSK